MKHTHAFLVCLCLLGATQVSWSQVKQPDSQGIRGYLDPKTGKFTTQVAPGTERGDAQAAASNQSIFFREDFKFTITNYDQASGSTVYCQVDLSSFGDAAGFYEETAAVVATATSGGYTCDVPILTLWTLQTPTSDTISASVSVSFGSTSNPLEVFRSSTQSLTLAQPGNAQTAVTNVKFQI